VNPLTSAALVGSVSLVNWKLAPRLARLKFLLTALGSMHTQPVARALQDRDALAGLWISGKNHAGIAPDKYRRCWPYHLAMKFFYHQPSQRLREWMTHQLLPIWAAWVRRQKPPPFDVAYGCGGGQGTELFEHAERIGALKVLDSSSSHPTSAYGFWQRECDIWNPGSKVATPRWMFSRWNRELERADIILCPSTFVRDSMLYNGIPESKCVLNPYGVDTSTFKPRTVVPEKPRFICVATICLRKGHQYLFRAFEKVKRVLPEAELICAGPHYPDFARERPRWQGTFTHYKGLSHVELTKLLQRCTAFVFPSNEEGFARSVVESMAAGLPIIATHESGATTLVNNGVEGIIVRARDVDQIADAMVRVAKDRALNERMGRAAATRVVNNSWGDFADRLIRICEKALARRKPAISKTD
jgi:glycosyltransferase involved in cell wall biosynthesis